MGRGNYGVIPVFKYPHRNFEEIKPGKDLSTSIRYVGYHIS